MPYFKLMSAINLYVAADWQRDREIERREEEGGWVTRPKEEKEERNGEPREWASREKGKES